ncbi:glycosyltransferase family 2 protein [Acinetobacter towneri]|uniref:glycosyltransferase family 2 protein n=1 Tax=Acinetobacter towneri TaxID=202956 RepID=UPI001CE16400|nr:glycosyltransferase [Acinetobacter towneri]MCA4790007.1 glycosyltransferase [Acinetobacter towneri]
MITPLLSVIIPTHKRPQFLPRAIESALQAALNGDIEVIVVPNGSDTSWKSVAEQFKDESRVKWHPIEKPHANVARNHGMKLAQGKYIRFLDDDDFLYPEAAQKQLEELIELDADISCGQITKTDEVGNILELAQQLNTDDFIEAAIGRGHSTQPGALVMKRSVTEGCIWDEIINKKQDVYWAWELCKKQELKSFRFRQAVSAWVQHDGQRLSKGHSVNQTSKETAKRALDVYFHLKDQKRLNEERKIAISSRLWRCVHNGLMFEPLYWIKISFTARRISKKGTPATPFYQILPHWLNPLVWELLIVPIRWVKVLTGHHYSN